MSSIWAGLDCLYRRSKRMRTGSGCLRLNRALDPPHCQRTATQESPQSYQSARSRWSESTRPKSAFATSLPSLSTFYYHCSSSPWLCFREALSACSSSPASQLRCQWEVSWVNKSEDWFHCWSVYYLFCHSVRLCWCHHRRWRLRSRYSSYASAALRWFECAATAESLSRNFSSYLPNTSPISLSCLHNLNLSRLFCLNRLGAMAQYVAQRLWLNEKREATHANLRWDSSQCERSAASATCYSLFCNGFSTYWLPRLLIRRRFHLTDLSCESVISSSSDFSFLSRHQLYPAATARELNYPDGLRASWEASGWFRQCCRRA